MLLVVAPAAAALQSAAALGLLSLRYTPLINKVKCMFLSSVNSVPSRFTPHVTNVLNQHNSFALTVPVCNQKLKRKTSCAGGRHNMPPPRSATEARSGSPEPGRSSRARSANARHPAGRTHTPLAGPDVTDARQTSDVRRASSLNAPWAGA